MLEPWVLVSGGEGGARLERPGGAEQGQRLFSRLLLDCSAEPQATGELQGPRSCRQQLRVWVLSGHLPRGPHLSHDPSEP